MTTAQYMGLFGGNSARNFALAIRQSLVSRGDFIWLDVQRDYLRDIAGRSDNVHWYVAVGGRGEQGSVGELTLSRAVPRVHHLREILSFKIGAVNKESSNATVPPHHLDPSFAV